MRVGVYAREDNLEAGAFAAGLLAQGYKPVWRSASDYKQGDVERFEAVVITGLRAQGAWIRDDYRARGIPVVVIDYGYLARVSGKATWETGHWQVSVDGLNRPPSFECPGDRFEALGVEIVPKRKAAKGLKPLVLGQHVGDPSHGLDAEAMGHWVEDQCWEFGARWRPHPDSPDVEVDAEKVEGTLAEAFAGASVVHTLCSTAGLDALLAGVPAVAHMPNRACWGELSSEKLPTVEARRALCARLAYGQWTLNEMRSGQAAAFVMENRWHW